MLCDRDRFKDYNDALGHQAGDDALRDIASLHDDQTRTGERVYRYGGEELLILLAQVLRRADQALYRAKSSGRNQVALADSEPLRQAIADTTH